MGIVYKGKKYKSEGELAHCIGVDPGVIRSGIRRGHTIEEIVDGRVSFDSCIEYNGEEYRNLRELCRKNELNFTSIKRRIENGMVLEDAIEDMKKNRVVYKGKEFKSLNSFCTHMGINTALMRYRIVNGMSVEEAVADLRRRERYVYKGVEYKNLAELAREVGVSYHLVRSRLKAGCSLRQAIEAKVQG